MKNEERIMKNGILNLAFGLVALTLFVLATNMAFAQTDNATLSQTILSLAECGDTIDNDGDTFIDFPADPDCTSLLDNSESPPPPSGTGNRPPLPTLEARLEAFPTIGIAPLYGVDFQIWVLGFARGPINYTLYCDWDNPTVVVAPPWDAKADGVLSNPYIVKDICTYEAPGVYTAKVIVERGGLAVVAFTNVEVLWVAQPTPKHEPIPTPKPMPEPPVSISTVPVPSEVEPEPISTPEPAAPSETEEELGPGQGPRITIPLFGTRIMIQIPNWFDFPLIVLLWILLIVSLIFAWLIYKGRRLR